MFIDIQIVGPFCLLFSSILVNPQTNDALLVLEAHKLSAPLDKTTKMLRSIICAADLVEPVSECLQTGALIGGVGMSSTVL